MARRLSCDAGLSDDRKESRGGSVEPSTIGESIKITDFAVPVVDLFL